MKIGYLINEYPKVSHSFVRREIEALERRGVEVEIFSIRPWSSDLTDPADVAHADRTTVIYGNSSDLSSAMKTEARTNRRALSATTAKAMKFAKTSEKSAAYWSAYVAEAARLRQLLSERNVDHVHAHFGTNSTAVAMLCRLLGGPTYSFTVHGPEEFDRQVGLSLTEKIEHASFVAGISSYGRSQLLRLAPADRRDDVHVVHCGLSEDYLASDTHPIGAAPQLVTVGRLSEQKGHWILLEAARLLAEDGIDFSLELVGDGELRPDVEAMIAEHGLGDRVQISGWATEDEVADALRRSRALVLPSFAEGLPVVIMEALALKRPVISTYVAGIPELVSPGECGWLVPAGDPAKLASAMRAVLAADPADLDRFGEEGAERVAQMHNVDVEAGRLIELFEWSMSTDAVRPAA
jgi:glycosyltransferase involved in cell wall biosynthesis